MSSAAPVIAPTETTVEDLLSDMWMVVVVNDDVNTFETVIKAFCQVLEYTPEGAARKAWEIHEKGSSVVWFGGREECVGKAQRLRDGYKIDARATD